MKYIDQIFGQEMEGKKTEYLALAASLVGVAVVVANQFFGIELGENIVSIMENVVAIGFALTLGARLSRNTEVTKTIEMNQPGNVSNTSIGVPATEEKVNV